MYKAEHGSVDIGSGNKHMAQAYCTHPPWARVHACASACVHVVLRAGRMCMSQSDSGVHVMYVCLQAASTQTQTCLSCQPQTAAGFTAAWAKPWLTCTA
jgi:hypothetical protein